jgi:hypothetical protein
VKGSIGMNVRDTISTLPHQLEIFVPIEIGSGVPPPKN